MKQKLILLLAIFISTHAYSQWKPAGDKIKTKWAGEIDVNNVLPEYPRPIMERTAWSNLNGLWEYAIKPIGQIEPSAYDGQILVPFAVESSLSGVQKRLDKENELWYKRTFSIPSDWKDKTILLHFGAVDWRTEVYINDVKIGSHTGGFAPFSFDVTPYLTSGNQKLVVKVWDPTTDGTQPVGKQHSNPHAIWYTPVSGIWQTVWLEPVNSKHINNLRILSDIDSKKLTVDAETVNTQAGDIVEVILKDGSKVVSKAKVAAGQAVELPVPAMKLWSPESPFLYDLEVNLYEKGKLQDNVKSYAAMRKYSTQRDENGIVRLQLNNKDYFQFGPLDQGWWPDGLYTAPTDEALVYDIKKTKDWGYNMIRKHAKTEPARWYTHCDRMGMIVWQDMPSGDRSPHWDARNYFTGTELVRSGKSEATYRKEWKEIMDYLYSYPSIAVWVPFNEAWGQFKTEEMAEWTKNYDPSRLVNPASGGNHYRTGDMLDLHTYPGPQLWLYDANRATVLGEYGGIGLPLKDHMWQTDKNWGYIEFQTAKEVTDEYVKYAEELKKLIKAGFSAAVYTQTTDVEVEVNGLMTYDRKVIKVEEGRIRKVNQEVCRMLDK
ncbi:glycoside hydrolase family 2 protein [Dysgonomonas sp. 511]|uniref:glycoside hydrolase family 2 protein n=1 Tax=Dysgonomonas sp. 511 TaxID=2302930 RepID=UPI0013D8A350|nr:sugar-binding domain-containing protein [Dysgonomonas sp. 511]NDV80178.1 beta-galactosidase [Dysgonomonas sp. 511]